MGAPLFDGCAGEPWSGHKNNIEPVPTFFGITKRVTYQNFSTRLAAMLNCFLPDLTLPLQIQARADSETAHTDVRAASTRDHGGRLKERKRRTLSANDRQMCF